jgi:hypothetical protein
MERRLDSVFTDEAKALVDENFTGVEGEWWWERRIGAAITICQELDPVALVREVAGELGRDEEEVRRAAAEELELEDFDPLTLTYDVPGNTPVGEAARLLREKSATPRGLVEGVYRRVRAAAQ